MDGRKPHYSFLTAVRTRDAARRCLPPPQHLRRQAALTKRLLRPSGWTRHPAVSPRCSPANDRFKWTPLKHSPVSAIPGRACSAKKKTGGNLKRWHSACKWPPPLKPLRHAAPPHIEARAADWIKNKCNHRGYKYRTSLCVKKKKKKNCAQRLSDGSRNAAAWRCDGAA